METNKQNDMETVGLCRHPKLSEGSLPSSDRPRTLDEGSQPERMSERAGREEVRVKPHLFDQYKPTHKPCSPLREH